RLSIFQTYIGHGRFELYINKIRYKFEEKSLYVDLDLMDQFFGQIDEIKARYQLSGDIPLSVITTMDEILSIKEQKQTNDGLHNFVLSSVEKVIKKVLKTRK